MATEEFIKIENRLVKDGKINVFNLKVLAFNICRGTRKVKVDILFDLLEPKNQHCYGKRIIKHDCDNLKEFIYNLFLF